MHWENVRPGHLFFRGGDPYFQLRTDRQGLKGFAAADPALRPVIVRLKDGDPASLARRDGVRVPSFYTNPAAGLKGTQHCTALASQTFIESLPGNSSISRITVLPPIDRQSVPRYPPHQSELPDVVGAAGDPDPATVVVGIIDFGIAFAHQRFRLTDDTSRIEYFWVQDAIQPAGAALTDPLTGLDEAPVGFVPAGAIGAAAKVNPVPYGRELSAPEVDGLLDRLANGGLTDEDSLYRHVAEHLGQHWLRSVSTRAAHGTHVLDLAGGYDLGQEDQETREQRPIVAVQLPAATTADTSGESLDAYAFDGIRYILDRADAIARQRGCGPLPVVINFSYGNVAGPHDGSSDLEQAIDELARARRTVAPLELIIPSGNSNLGRLHAEFRFDERGRTVALRWRVLPDDKTPSFLEIWLPRPDQEDSNPWKPGDSSRIRLTIRAPGGQPSEPLEEDDGAGIQLRSNGDEVLCEARYRYIPGPPGHHGRGMFLVALQPTTQTDPPAPVAPSGIWTVELDNLSLQPGGLIEAWIQRDDTPFGFPSRGRQSYFDQECYRRFDAQGRVIESDYHPAQAASPCLVKRAGSANAIATGEETIVVGGIVRREARHARYSAWSGAGAPQVPRYLAPSDESLVRLGIRAAGTRSGSVVTMNGTSVAAPRVARWIADQLAAQSIQGGPAALVDLGPAEVYDAQTGRPATPFFREPPKASGPE